MILAASVLPTRLYWLAAEPADSAQARSPSGRRSLAQNTMCRSPGAVGPASRLWRRYADAPAATLINRSHGCRMARAPLRSIRPFSSKANRLRPSGRQPEPLRLLGLPDPESKRDAGNRDGLEVERESPGHPSRRIRYGKRRSENQTQSPRVDMTGPSILAKVLEHYPIACVADRAAV
jgi:hypothetical protein